MSDLIGCRGARQRGESLKVSSKPTLARELAIFLDTAENCGGAQWEGLMQWVSDNRTGSNKSSSRQPAGVFFTGKSDEFVSGGLGARSG
jgi:hypothetical protein